jgi:hypothetical protein
MKRALKKAMQQRPGAPQFAREGVRLLDLAEDFRLANDYGIQPAHDLEKMPHTFFPFVSIESAAILAGRRFSPRQTMRDLFRGDDVRRCRIKFHTIARPESPLRRNHSSYATIPAVAWTSTARASSRWPCDG